MLYANVLNKRVKCTIVFGTETGNSEKFARKFGDIAKTKFNSKVLCMNEYKAEDLPKEQLFIVIVSTHGNGDAPQNAEDFKINFLNYYIILFTRNLKSILTLYVKSKYI